MTDAAFVPGNPLAVKIATIAASVKGRVAKDGENQYHHYRYATATAIVEAIRETMNGLDVAIIPRVLPETIQITPLNDRGMMMTTLVVEFDIIDGVSGHREIARYPGAGSDVGDKGAYKAMTGAQKYLYEKLFNIPTGDDPESGEEPVREEPRVAPVARPVPVPVPSAAPPEPARRSSASPTVTRVEEKKGTNARGEWTLYIVRFGGKVKASDGAMVADASTFDAKLADVAREAMASGLTVTVGVDPHATKKGSYTLTALELNDIPF